LTPAEALLFTIHELLVREQTSTWWRERASTNLPGVPANDPARLLHDIGRRLKELRVARKLTQEAFAERLDVTTRYVQRVEKGDQNVSVEVLADFANGLGVPIAALFKAPSKKAVEQVRPNRKKRAGTR
jgi:DNA-binding XRE family transcriptional regulator